MSQQNWISLLKERFQSFGVEPRYTFHRIGPDHNPIFTCGVNMFNRSATATGKSKKMAKNRAASLLLKKFETPSITAKTPPNSPSYHPTSPSSQIKFEPTYDTNVDVYIEIKQEKISPNPNTLHLFQDSPKFIPIYPTITPRKLFQ